MTAAAPHDPGPAPLSAAGLAGTYGLTRTAADVLARLGIEPGPSLERWLDPKLADLTPPHAMVDRAAATDRIDRDPLGRKDRRLWRLRL